MAATGFFYFFFCLFFLLYLTLPYLTLLYCTCEVRSAEGLRGLTVSIELIEPVPHVLFEQRLVILVPPTERGSVLGDVACGPHDPKLVDFWASLVVRADDVEFACTYAVDLCVQVRA